MGRLGISSQVFKLLGNSETRQSTTYENEQPTFAKGISLTKMSLPLSSKSGDIVCTKDN